MFTGGLQRGLHQLNGFITRAQFGCVSAAAVASALKGQEDRATVCPPVRAAKEAPAKVYDRLAKLREHLLAMDTAKAQET